MSISNSSPTLTALKREFQSPLLAWLMDNRIGSWLITGAAGLQLGLTGLGLPGWRCPFLHVLGLPCPGCGLSRATTALLQGDFSQTLMLHAFAPIVGVGLLLIAVSAVLPYQPRYWLIETLARVERRTGITALLLIALLLYWLIRLIIWPDLFFDLVRS